MSVKKTCSSDETTTRLGDNPKRLDATTPRSDITAPFAPSRTRRKNEVGDQLLRYKGDETLIVVGACVGGMEMNGSCIL